MAGFDRDRFDRAILRAVQRQEAVSRRMTPGTWEGRSQAAAPPAEGARGATVIPDRPQVLGAAYVQKAGDTMTGNLHFNTEGRGVIVDAQGFKRFGLMKYSGYQPTIVIGAGASAYIGHTNKATVDDLSAGFAFTPDITIAGDGKVTFAQRAHYQGGVVARWFDSPFAPGTQRIELDNAQIWMFPPSGGRVIVSSSLGGLGLKVSAGDIWGPLRSVNGSGSGIEFAWDVGGGTLDVYVDGTYEKSL